MKSRLATVVASAAILGAVVGLVPASPAAADPVLVQVCVTLNPRHIALSVNDTQVIGENVVAYPRTCTGV